MRRRNNRRKRHDRPGERAEQCDAVRRALDGNDVDTLRALALQPGGFETPELRRRAWLCLLGQPDSDSTVHEVLFQRAKGNNLSRMQY